MDRFRPGVPITITAPEPVWRRASLCVNNDCVEVRIGEGVSARSSRKPGAVVEYDRDEWRVFVAAVKAGEFDV